MPNVWYQKQVLLFGRPARFWFSFKFSLWLFQRLRVSFNIGLNHKFSLFLCCKFVKLMFAFRGFSTDTKQQLTDMGSIYFVVKFSTFARDLAMLLSHINPS